MEILVGSWGNTMRGAVWNKERWTGRRAPTQYPSTNHRGMHGGPAQLERAGVHTWLFRLFRPAPACVDRDCDFFEEVGSVANVKNKQNIFADPFIWHRHECNAGRLPPNCVERGPQARPASTRILG